MTTRTSNLLATVVLIGFTLFGTCSAQSTENVHWGGGTIGDRAVSVKGLQVDISFTGDSRTVFGELVVANVASGTYTPINKVIRGRWHEQRFWPAITLDVADKFDGPWYAVALKTSGAMRDKVVIKPGETAKDWRVDLDPLRKYIGKREVGRLSLSSGDSVVFELSNLVRPR
jgi:hypothetical protein